MVTVVPAEVGWLEALVQDNQVFSHRFGIDVVAGWAGFPEAVPAALDGVRRQPGDPWGKHLFFDDDGALVGFGGWKGAPKDGVAELGYAVAPARQGRGIATAVVRELLDRAHAAGLTTATAHTLAEENASVAVLRKTGFIRTAELLDPDVGTVWRWERTLDRFAQDP